MEDSSVLAPIARRLEGKVALITGGASGIGQTTARLFVQHGAKVVIADIQDELGLALCEEIGSQDNISYIHCDVTNEQNVQEAVDATIERYNKLDIMFSNAGIDGNMETITKTDGFNLKRVFEINVFGAFYCAKHAARVMIPAKAGTILFTASVVSVTAGLASHPYKASKNAVVGLTESLCVELGEHGIRVNCISPHVLHTPLVTKALGTTKQKLDELVHESGNLKNEVLEAKDVAEAAVYLGSDDSKYVSGLNMVLDGGYSRTNPSLNHALRKMRA